MSKILLVSIGAFPPPQGGVPQVNTLVCEGALDQGLASSCLQVDLAHKKIRWTGDTETPLRTGRLLVSALLGVREVFRGLKWMIKEGVPGQYLWYVRSVVVAVHVLRVIRRRSAASRGFSDVRIWCHHLGAPLLVGGAVARELGVAVVLSTYGEAMINRDRLIAVRRLWRTVEVRYVLSCSRWCADAIDSLEIFEKAHVVYPTSLLLRDNPSPSRVKRDGGSLPVVTFLGRLTAEMGIWQFLGLVSLDASGGAEFSWQIAGQSCPDTPAVLSEIESRGLPVRVLADCSGPEKVNILQHTDVLLVLTPGARACFGLAILEGVHLGVPTFALDVGGHREVFGDYGTTFLLSPSESSAQILTRIRDFLSNTGDEGITSLQQYCRDTFGPARCLQRHAKYLFQDGSGNVRPNDP